MRISRQASLKKFNTFNVSENADVIYEVEDISMLKNIVSDNNQILILGGGSNILFTKSYNGAIINLRNKGIKVLDEEKESVLVDVCSVKIGMILFSGLLTIIMEELKTYP